MSDKKTVAKSTLKIEDLIRFGTKTGFVCYIEDAQFARRVSVENVGENGVCVNMEKMAGEAIISTQIRLSHHAAEALSIMIGKLIGDGREQ